MDQKTEIKARAFEAGFHAIGFAPAWVGAREQDRLDAFVAKGEHGEMGWMADTLARRRDPTVLWPEARSVVVLAMNYGPDEDPMDALERPSLANISCYAQNRDYHDLIKKRLKRVARWIAETQGADVKVFVDTAPVMEKPLASLAGVGWQGKHTNLVSRAFGSWLFLGEIFTTLEIDPDTPHDDHCGGCRSCLDICPTDAFPAPYELDARRCISYLTIEHKGPIPHEFRAPIGNRIYGCDDCLAVCPWNKFATATDEPWFQARDAVRDAPLARFLDLEDAAFREMFSGSPIKRIGRDRFLRNVLIACGNSGDAGLVTPVQALLADESALVRGAAVWALARLAPDAAAHGRAKAVRTETDPDVLAEWSSIGGEA